MTHIAVTTLPGRRWLLGHALQLRADGFALLDAARGSDIAVLYLGPKPAYVVADPRLVQQLLTAEDRHLDKGPLYEALASLIGRSVGTLTGRPHRIRRRIVAPAYTPNPGVIARTAQQVATSWQPGSVVDLAVEMRRLSLLVMTRSLFGSLMPPAAEEEFVSRLPVALDGIARWMADPTGVLKRTPTPANRRAHRSLARLQEITMEAVEAYRAGGSPPSGMLARLTEARSPESGLPLTGEQVRDEAIVLLSAGSETMAGLLSFACKVIAEDSDVAQKLQAEADQVVGQLPVTGEHLADLTYTRRFVAEVLRMWPPGALMSRRAVAEIDLGGYTIPAGAAVFFSPYLLHRRSPAFPDPDRFDPDRWRDEHKAPPRGSYAPFGGGGHICLGEQIAWSEAITAVATISRLWRLQLAPGPRPRPVLAPTLNLDAVRALVHPRPSHP